MNPRSSGYEPKRRDLKTFIETRRYRHSAFVSTSYQSTRVKQSKPQARQTNIVTAPRAKMSLKGDFVAPKKSKISGVSVSSTGMFGGVQGATFFNINLLGDLSIEPQSLNVPTAYDLIGKETSTAWLGEKWFISECWPGGHRSSIFHNGSHKVQNIPGDWTSLETMQSDRIVFIFGCKVDEMSLTIKKALT